MEDKRIVWVRVNRHRQRPAAEVEFRDGAYGLVSDHPDPELFHRVIVAPSEGDVPLTPDELAKFIYIREAVFWKR